MEKTSPRTLNQGSVKGQVGEPGSGSVAGGDRGQGW